MTYRKPTTQIVLIKGCPLDRNYNNTFYFRNRNEQENFFTKTHYNGGSIYTKSFYSAYSYQRYEEGEIFIEGRYDSMIGHNYICFKNFEDGKWYYGFIDDMEYINENTTRVSYTIDVMQTWYFNYTMTTTFVEREHTETDVVGEHLVPEGLDVGEMVCTSTKSYDIGDLTLVISYTPNYDKKLGIIDSTKVLGGIDGIITEIQGINENMYNSFVGVPNMSFCYFLNLSVSNYSTKLRNVIDRLTVIEANIVSVYAIPSRLINIRGHQWGDADGSADIGYDPDNVGTKYGNYVWYISSTNTENFELNQPARFEDINGNYYPKNKKLYTSPYCSLVVSNNNGDTNTYSWEESAIRQTNGLKKMNFKVNFCFFNTPLLNLYPTDYRGLYDDFENNVPITEFIEPFWSVDSFAQWWATNKEVMALTIVKSVIMGISSPVIAGASAVNSYKLANPLKTERDAERVRTTATKNSSMSSTMSTIDGISSSLMTGLKAKNTPDSYQKGNYSPAYNRLKDKDGYTAYYMNCHTEIAESIDNYFTMFGYAIKKLKVPNIKNYGAKLRPHWNFVKTAGCHIMPDWNIADDVIIGTLNSMPKEAEELINSIYDKGVTFWMHNGGELGDYTLDNSPTV